MLLLRLRQICSHPSLIQEDGVAFVHPDEAEVQPEFATELTRAKRLVSPEFVTKMKEKFLNAVRVRMERERLVRINFSLVFVNLLLMVKFSPKMQPSKKRTARSVMTP